MHDLSLKGQVAVAVSGGMDSLYSLLALKEQGAEVFAVHALFLPEYLRAAQAREDLARLESAVKALGVRLEVVDLSARFEELVIRPFIESYVVGKTPNPCARCNLHLKFGLLWEAAARSGAAHLATGHYVKLLHLPADSQSGSATDGTAQGIGLFAGEDAERRALRARSATPGIGLFAGEDAEKDQSYFLAMTPLEKLARAVFPLARRKKKEIAAELAARGIEVPQKGESQEICFIRNDDYRAFLKEHAPRFGLALPGPGTAVLPNGAPVGRHHGLWAYTQGQRHGLGIAWKEPLYVLGKDTAANRLIVGPRADFGHAPCHCINPNFFLPPEAWPEKMLVKTRYRQHPQLVQPELLQEAGQVRLTLHFAADAAQPPAAPGQIAALYIETEHGLRLAAGAEIA